MANHEQLQSQWINKGQPGFLGKTKEQQYAHWDKEFGKNNWRICWVLPNGEILGFDQMFQLYVESYTKYFREHWNEAIELTKNHSFTYDKTLITPDLAFNPYALVNKPGIPNQFHHVALNLALIQNLGLKFQGENPLQVRDGKPNQPKEEWPLGWKWGPGRIPLHDLSLMPNTQLKGWWDKNSIESLYQTTKILQVIQKNHFNA